jgi:ABC-2 type transport system ATP-binding protein
VDPGEVVGLLGPNGAGKSTLMKIITCFIPPTSGKVNVYGYDVISDPIPVKKRIGYLPENNPLYTDLYVREYLEFTAGVYKLGAKSRKRVEEIIDITGLATEQHKKIGALSKGFRQRVGLAQAMIHDPAVLIMDEPTSGLDPNQLLEIRNLIKDIGRSKTVILSTHIMQEVEAMCGRAIIIDKGKIIADDHPSILSKLSDDSDTILVELNREVELPVLQKIPGVVSVISDGTSRYRIKAKRGTDLRPLIFHFAVEQGLTVLSMNRLEQSLEQVFQQLTKK